MTKMRYPDGSGGWAEIDAGAISDDQGNRVTASDILEMNNNFDAHLADNMSHVHYAIDTGTANAKVVTLNPAPSAYKDGMAITFKNNIQNTGSVTINVNGLGARAVLKSNGNALSSGNLKAGIPYTLRYNGTNFILQGEGGEYGTATAPDVLAGKTIGTENGIVTGTIPVRSGHVNAQSISRSGTSLRLRPPQGYVPGDAGNSVQITHPTIDPANIRENVNFAGSGLIGTLQEGLPMIAGTTLLYSNSGIGNTMSDVYTLALEFIINVTGTYTVRFSLSASSGHLTFGRIYKNGVPYGVERSTTNGDWTSFSENLSFSKGDRLGIYTRRNVGTIGGWCGQFSLSINGNGLATRSL